MGRGGMVFAFIALLAAAPARGQTTTTGAISGRLRDRNTGELLPGAWVMAVSPGPPEVGEQTDEGGEYMISNLEPGEYTLFFFSGAGCSERPHVMVFAGKRTMVIASIDPSDEKKSETCRSHRLSLSTAAASSDFVAALGRWVAGSVVAAFKNYREVFHRDVW